MATTLLPSTQIVSSKKTISADSITSVSKSDSTAEKLESIRKFLTLDFNRDKSSFIMKRKQRQEEKRKLREENIEKKKKSKSSLPSVNIPTPLSDIFSSISNFLLFLGGGILFNQFFDLQKGLVGIEKILGVIGRGVVKFTELVGSVTNFIDASVKGYDNFMKSFENITGIKQTDVEKFLEKFKLIINGGVIAALIALRSLPAFLRGRGRGGGGRNLRSGRSGFTPRQLLNTRGNPAIRRYVQRYGPDAARIRFGDDAVRNLGGRFARSSVTNLGRRGLVSVLGRSGTKTLLQFSKRFISPILKRIPIVGALIDFLLNFFVFKEPLGRAALKAIGAGLFGAIGAAIGGPFAFFTGIGGAMLGDWAGGQLADILLGDQSGVDVADIQVQGDYDMVVENNNIVIQPIITG